MKAPGVALTAALALLATAASAAPAPDSGITDALVRAHIGFLASDALNGRGSGTRDEWIAATYIASQFQRLGLKPLGDDGGFVQTVEVARTEVTEPPTLHVGTAKYSHGEDMLVRALEEGAVSGALQKFRKGKSLAPGTFVLLPKDANEKIRKSVAKAAGVLIAENDRLRAYWKDLARTPLTAGEPRIVALGDGPAAPQQLQIVLSSQVYEAVAAMKDGTPVSFAATTRPVRFKTWNALGELPGADPKTAAEALLLSAHLDHLGANDDGNADAKTDRIFNGADDDASGTTAVLALAEALAHGAPLRRSVVFALFGSEESGGFGAQWVVARPPVPLERIVANLEFEMIGRPDDKVPAKTLWVTGWERSDLGPELAKHGARLVADPHPQENFFMRSDNITLARRGVVAQTISSFGLHGEYHQPDDDIAHIDFGHMTEAIQSMVGSIRWLANSDFRPGWRPGGRP